MARLLRCIASRFPQQIPPGQLDLPLHPRVVASCLPRRRLPPRPARPPAVQHAVQLVIAYPSRPRRHRPVNPHAAANALALQHRDIAQTVAANISRRTGHPRDDLEQIAMIGILQAARRYSPERGTFRPYARTYANGVTPRSEAGSDEMALHLTIVPVFCIWMLGLSGEYNH